MSSQRFITLHLCVLAVACAAWGDEGKVYSGTFKDDAGHNGPLQCTLVPKGEGTWTASLSGKNTGSGPNKPYQYSGEFTGKADGASMNLSGDVALPRQGPYAITAVLKDNALQATFKKKDGGGNGSFDLTLGKSDAPAAPVEPKKEAPAPAAPTAEAPK